MHTAKLPIAQQEHTKKGDSLGFLFLWPWSHKPQMRVLFKINITGDGYFMKKDPAGTKDDFQSHCSFKDTIKDQYLEFCTELISLWRKLWPRDMSA